MKRTALNTGAAALSAALFASASHGADGDGRYASDAPGTVTCSVVTAHAPDTEAARILAGFAAGYMSAHSKLMEDVFDITPWQTPEYVMLQARRFCEANPTLRFTNALDAYVQFLEADAVPEAQPMRPVTNSGQTVLLYDVTIAAIQARLNELGFPSPEGLEGLAAFQIDQGLDVTGVPDQSTLAILFGG